MAIPSLGCLGGLPVPQTLLLPRTCCFIAYLHLSPSFLVRVMRVRALALNLAVTDPDPSPR